MTKLVISLVAVVFIGGLAFATMYVLIDEGPDVLTLIGLVVVIVLSLGVVGALTEPSKRPRR